MNPLSQLWHLLLALRPKQWAKNLLLYLAFFFTLGDHAADDFSGEISLFGWATLGFFAFSILSGVTYIINDYFDIEEDRLHPKKQHRPLASGRLHHRFALVAAVALAALGLALSFLINANFGYVAIVYLALTVGYSVRLKDFVIIDVMAVAGGFVLRAAAGALAIDVPISPWLYIMTSLGALLISFGKRRNEMATLETSGENQRPVLKDYSVGLLDQFVAIVAPATLVAYALYTFTADNLPENNAMMLTIPFVMFGLFRYLYLIHKKNLGGSPEEIFLTDKPLILNILAWFITAASIIAATR